MVNAVFSLALTGGVGRYCLLCGGGLLPPLRLGVEVRCLGGSGSVRLLAEEVLAFLEGDVDKVPPLYLLGAWLAGVRTFFARLAGNSA